MSKRRTLALTGVLVLIALSAVGCEEWCRDNDFILEADCPPPVEPPPGPPIVLEPDPGGTMNWRIDGNPATSSGTVFSACELRYDFIGIGIIDFNVYESGSTTALSGKHVVIENGDYKIEIKRSYLNTFVWEVYDKATTSPEIPCLNVAPAAAVDYQLPDEFLAALDGTITEEHHGVTVERIELRVKLPVP